MRNSFSESPCEPVRDGPPVRLVVNLRPVRILLDETGGLNPEFSKALTDAIINPGTGLRPNRCPGTLVIRVTPASASTRFSKKTIRAIIRRTTSFLGQSPAKKTYLSRTAAGRSLNHASTFAITWEFFPIGARVPDLAVADFAADLDVKPKVREVQADLMDNELTPRPHFEVREASPERQADMNLAKAYLSNRPRLGPSLLAPYTGGYIAWSSDGTSVVAHADDQAQLFERIADKGVALSQCVIENVDFLSED